MKQGLLLVVLQAVLWTQGMAQDTLLKGGKYQFRERALIYEVEPDAYRKETIQSSTVKISQPLQAPMGALFTIHSATTFENNASYLLTFVDWTIGTTNYSLYNDPAQSFIFDSGTKVEVGGLSVYKRPIPQARIFLITKSELLSHAGKQTLPKPPAKPNETDPNPPPPLSSLISLVGQAGLADVLKAENGPLPGQLGVGLNIYVFRDSLRSPTNWLNKQINYHKREKSIPIFDEREIKVRYSISDSRDTIRPNFGLQSPNQPFASFLLTPTLGRQSFFLGGSLSVDDRRALHPFGICGSITTGKTLFQKIREDTSYHNVGYSMFTAGIFADVFKSNADPNIYLRLGGDASIRNLTGDFSRESNVLPLMFFGVTDRRFYSLETYATLNIYHVTLSARGIFSPMADNEVLGKKRDITGFSGSQLVITATIVGGAPLIKTLRGKSTLGETTSSSATTTIPSTKPPTTTGTTEGKPEEKNDMQNGENLTAPAPKPVLEKKSKIDSLY